MLAHVSRRRALSARGMLYDRRHTFEISEYGGLARRCQSCGVLLFLSHSIAGLPMLNGLSAIPGPARTYQRHWQWAVGRTRRDPFRLLPAVVVSAGVFGEITREKKPVAPRCLRARKVDSGDMAIVTLWMAWLDFITARTALSAQS